MASVIPFPAPCCPAPTVPGPARSAGGWRRLRAILGGRRSRDEAMPDPQLVRIMARIWVTRGGTGREG
ncbi:hypothetical protein [Ferrovibrio sp.]|uniref:hypothetical protein n=1 Tax=Ferrovibrio sp. TaxID=1917215 RepID=UPI003510EDA1